MVALKRGGSKQLLQLYSCVAHLAVHLHFVLGDDLFLKIPPVNSLVGWPQAGKVRGQLGVCVLPNILFLAVKRFVSL